MAQIKTLKDEKESEVIIFCFFNELEESYRKIATFFSLKNYKLQGITFEREKNFRSV